MVRGPKQPQPGMCLVEAGDTGLTAYVPPPGITRKGAIGTQDRRRTYDRGARVLDDALLADRVGWHNRSLAAALAEAVASYLQRCLRSLLEE